MRYVEPEVLTKEEAEKRLECGDAHCVRETLVSIALNEPDGDWAQQRCVFFAKSQEPTIRAVAATCLGHLARIHKRLDLAVVRPLLEGLLSDPVAGPAAETALEDIEWFMFGRTSS